MWSTPSDRQRAENRERRDREGRERARTKTMTVEQRLDRWFREEAGDETEEPIDLLSDARDEIRRLSLGALAALLERPS